MVAQESDLRCELCECMRGEMVWHWMAFGNDSIDLFMCEKKNRWRHVMAHIAGWIETVFNRIQLNFHIYGHTLAISSLVEGFSEFCYIRFIRV